MSGLPLVSFVGSSRLMLCGGGGGGFGRGLGM